MIAAQESSTEVRDLRAWSGSRQDLAHIAQVIEQQFRDDPKRAKVRRGLYTKAKAWLLRQPLPKPDLSLEHVVLTITDSRNRTVADQYTKLLEDGDLRLQEATTIQLERANYRPSATSHRSCAIYMSKSEQPGVRAAVVGDPQWVPGALQTLEAEVTRNRPWWWRFKQTWIAAGMAVLVFIAAMVGYVAYIEWLDQFKVPDVVAIPAVFVPIGILFFVFVAFRYFSSRYFPPFEIREVGLSTTRERVVRVISILLASLGSAIGVLRGLVWAFDNVL